MVVVHVILAYLAIHDPLILSVIPQVSWFWKFQFVLHFCRALLKEFSAGKRLAMISKYAIPILLGAMFGGLLEAWYTLLGTHFDSKLFPFQKWRLPLVAPIMGS